MMEEKGFTNQVCILFLKIIAYDMIHGHGSENDGITGITLSSAISKVHMNSVRIDKTLAASSVN